MGTTHRRTLVEMPEEPTINYWLTEQLSKTVGHTNLSIGLIDNKKAHDKIVT